MNYDPKKYWTERGKDYSVSADTSDELNNLKALMSFYGAPGDYILEIGPGYGRIYNYLSDNNCLMDKAYFMCDISEPMILECFKRTDLPPRLWDGNVLPYVSNTFDWVISFSVMLHVPPAEMFNHFKETARVCRKYLYIATYDGPARGLAKHCFKHDYYLLFDLFGLKIVDSKPFMDGLRMNWLLEKG